MVVVMVAYAAAAMAASCGWTTPDGGYTFDLSPLIKTAADWEGSDEFSDYSVNVCDQPVQSRPPGCGDRGYSACGYSKQSGRMTAQYGSVAKQAPVWSLIGAEQEPVNRPEPAENGVQYVVSNGASCFNPMEPGADFKRSTYFIFRCTSSARAQSRVHVRVDDQWCHTWITFFTPAACPVAKVGPNTIQSCQWRDPATGARFDVSSLRHSHHDWTYKWNAEYNVTFNLCGATVNPGPCRNGNFSFCRYAANNGSFALGLASHTLAMPYGSWRLYEPGLPERGVRQQFFTGEYCYLPGRAPKPRQVTVDFLCQDAAASKGAEVAPDADAPPVAFWQAYEMIESCWVYAVIASPAGCPL